MSQATGVTRPGGRTARTRAAVHAATRELLAESADGTVEIAAVAARSGVHIATIYRRWRSAEGLIIDTIVAELSARAPLPATGDLRADMLAWTTNLLADLRGPHSPAFLRSLTRAGAGGETELIDAAKFLEPRAREIQATLDASGTTVLHSGDVFEIILSPAYVRALVSAPLDPGVDAARLVDNLIAVRDHRVANG
ncbi:TetR/AcrR family transcriptional regulator C-terminal ligand-binding domain-containing protein [Nocardia sp. CA2R105]|uniref:TetR/AcrR family transcriptional regulator C-terminal ligand-binding domain-containing protein n=1 Tax=Nocardia coffeae TaxID=2873381 RepID=UPI001CA6ACF0|nr:TetR/AcrR family transcriptional regulator C-terminal ligand-binding domain-containing protein [Nocardia coffeae]MBY8862816.1 TetR/AcrR family transcriptional regulator C-terminal ligand-binding domain-containing protein [Nocardia coffeae]